MHTVLVCSMELGHSSYHTAVSLPLGSAKDGGEGKKEQRGGPKT